MKPVLQTLAIFAGTLVAAALVALGAPADAEVDMASAAPVVVAMLGL